MGSVEEILAAISRLPAEEKARLELVMALRNRPADAPEPVEADRAEMFERVKKFVLTKNAELYRRLA